MFSDFEVTGKEITECVNYIIKDSLKAYLHRRIDTKFTEFTLIEDLGIAKKHESYY